MGLESGGTTKLKMLKFCILSSAGGYLVFANRQSCQGSMEN